MARIDPLVCNLLVAKSIPSLAHLVIPRYQQWADDWADAIRAWLPSAERTFQKTPEAWRNDIHFFRLGMVHQFLKQKAGLEYNEHQRDVVAIRYTNPSDLFLNGVMDTRRGTCGNMAALQVAIGWRLGYPVSLAYARSHLICRYEDGHVTHNIEATVAMDRAFSSPSDTDLIERFKLPPVAVACGSDLRALTPREMLGVFVGLRARHMRDIGCFREAESDFLLGRWLFPGSRLLYCETTAQGVQHSVEMFEAGEIGSPQNLASTLLGQYGERVVRTRYPGNPNKPIPIKDERIVRVIPQRKPTDGRR